MLIAATEWSYRSKSCPHNPEDVSDAHYTFAAHYSVDEIHMPAITDGVAEWRNTKRKESKGRVRPLRSWQTQKMNASEDA